jgi:hypothetical protein
LFFSKLVFKDDVADLFDLVSFALFGLKVEDFFDAGLAENVVAVESGTEEKGRWWQD